MHHHPKPLTFKLEQKPGVLILHLCGDAGITGIDAMSKAMATALASDTRLLVIDGSQLDHIGSMGLGVLMRLHVKMKARGTRIAIAGTTPNITEMLRHLHIEQLMPMYASVEEALRVEADDAGAGKA